ncbi:Rha family transcriptional regulator [Francisella tularensis]|uniref:Rha family transcriptional regulator n=1 Tax=Francisella tularensis TaxID=263 RepID=UPI0008F49411|nr:Rha family transcriptional regulator [Francisella tularensis]APA83277.1 putative phage-encoded protein [Francisella tularensis subsp. novicida PA10-7858]
MKEINIFQNNNQVLTTSNDIAKVFNKRHSDVIRATESLDIPNDYRERNFALSFKEVVTGNGAIRTYKQYHITKDGFVLLAMGFTGKKAMEFKIAYINAFNAMQETLISQQTKELKSEIAELKNNQKTLTPAQERKIQQIVAHKAKNSSEHYQTIYRNIKDKFEVGSYKDVLQSDFNQLVEYLGGDVQPRSTITYKPNQDILQPINQNLFDKKDSELQKMLREFHKQGHDVYRPVCELDFLIATISDLKKYIRESIIDLESKMNKNTPMITDKFLRPTYMWRTLGIDTLKK